MALRPRGGLTPDLFYFQKAKPSKGLTEKVIFPAHISALNDSFSPSWQSTNDMGRADPIVSYSSIERTIAITFIVVATSKQEQKDNFEKLQKLATFVLPFYKSGYGFNASHVFFKIGKKISGYGYLSSLDYSWNPSETPMVDDFYISTEVSMIINVLGDRSGRRISAENYSIW